MAERNTWLKRECAGWYSGDLLGHDVVIRRIVPFEDVGYGLSPVWIAEIDGKPSDTVTMTKRMAVRDAEAAVFATEAAR